MSTPATATLLMDQGASFIRAFDLSANFGDIAGALIEFNAKVAYTDVTRVIEVSTGTGEIVITNGPAGEFQLNITPAVTALLTFDSAIYNLDLTLSGVLNRLLIGKILLTKEV